MTPITKTGLAIISGFILLGLGLTFSGSDRRDPAADPKPAARAGEYAIDLGQVPADLPSARQAGELLALIRSIAGKSRYQLTYQTPQDVVIFGCDFQTDGIFRLHQHPGGTGTAERWQGYVEARLRTAASGAGTLNDTPAGRRPGDFQRF